MLLLSVCLEWHCYWSYHPFSRGNSRNRSHLSLSHSFLPHGYYPYSRNLLCCTHSLQLNNPVLSCSSLLPIITFVVSEDWVKIMYGKMWIVISSLHFTHLEPYTQLYFAHLCMKLLYYLLFFIIIIGKSMTKCHDSN